MGGGVRLAGRQPLSSNNACFKPSSRYTPVKLISVAVVSLRQKVHEYWNTVLSIRGKLSAVFQLFGKAPRALILNASLHSPADLNRISRELQCKCLQMKPRVCTFKILSAEEIALIYLSVFTNTPLFERGQRY